MEMELLVKVNTQTKLV